jgi:Fe-S oxidoreductase
MWMEETRGTRINGERTRQVLETGAETLATACPFCMVMLRDGIQDAGRGTGSEAPVTSQDISELLAAAVIAPRDVPAGRALPVL